MRTYSDLVDRLRVYVGSDSSDTKNATILRCAIEACEALAQKHDWAYYKTRFRFTGSVPYQTGTIEYTSSTRTITLTGGTFPDWAQYGTITIDNVPYDVQKSVSSTVVILDPNSCPSADVAAGTEYVFYRTKYPLPTDFVSMHKPFITAQYLVLGYVTWDQFLLRRNLNDGVGTPTMFTVIDNGYGRKMIQLWNPPDQTYAFEMEYKRKPAAPTVEEESAGTIALTSGDATVTGTSTAFRASMAGAVLRVSYDTKRPTAYDSIEPPQYEYLIDSYTSSTSLELSEAASASVSKRAYTISSRLDVADGPMFSYLVQMGMKRLRIALRMNMVQGELQDYERAEREARDADGQNYGGTDRASVSQCAVDMPQWYGSWTRTIPGNG